jgi:dihydrodipicolinate synthase/N-acetylneuraminate lyase
MKMNNLGVLVPIVTPCNRMGQPNLEEVKKVCQYFYSAGCHGIFVLGSTGRGPWFGRSDRENICRAAKEQIGDNLPLFAGCTALGLTDMLENARAMAGSGANAVVLTCPGYFNYNEHETESIFLEFADKSPLPVMIYDIPAFTGSQLDTSMVTRLSKHENVIGLKDSSADIERFKQLTSTLRNVDDFYLIQGKEHLLAESILNGASGLTVSLIHVNPKPFVELYDAAVCGNKDLANNCQIRVIQIMQLVVESFKKRPEISTLFHFLNYALNKNVICDNILLEHEGDCPDWLSAKAAQAIGA